ncbi:MAG: tetratricopeptide repeat protein [Myxococcaceae bacterium]
MAAPLGVEFLTVRERAPYTSDNFGSEDRRAFSERPAILRLLLIAPLFALAACATGEASRTELFELKAQLRALREDNARLSKRLDRLELMDQIGGAQKKGPAGPSRVAAQVPQLTVVKLKPRVDPAPRVDTRVAVVEPAPAVLDELAASAPARPDRDDDDLPPDLAGGEQAFEAGLSALKTGNVVGGIEKLQRFAAENAKHPRADNALYYAGLGLIALNDYEDAAHSFAQLIESYPAGDAVVDGMLKLAECRVRLNQPGDAKAIYQKVLASYPGTPAASLAEAKLGSPPLNAATGSP